MKIFAAALAASLACASVSATTVNWSFTSDTFTDSKTGLPLTGAGSLTYSDTTDVVTAFSGQYMGQLLSLVTFTTDPNNPGAEISSVGGGLYTYRAVPNTGSANFTFDGLFHQTYSTSGYLVSTGTGPAETVYVLNIDRKNGIEEFNFFSDPAGTYRQDFGAFVTTPSAAPEPASWAMMIGGFGLVGGAMRRRKGEVAIA